jgi:hypothetical protein
MLPKVSTCHPHHHQILTVFFAEKNQAVKHTNQPADIPTADTLNEGEKAKKLPRQL